MPRRASAVSIPTLPIFTRIPLPGVSQGLCLGGDFFFFEASAFSDRAGGGARESAGGGGDSLLLRAADAGGPPGLRLDLVEMGEPRMVIPPRVGLLITLLNDGGSSGCPYSRRLCGVGSTVTSNTGWSYCCSRPPVGPILLSSSKNACSAPGDHEAAGPISPE